MRSLLFASPSPQNWRIEEIARYQIEVVFFRYEMAGSDPAKWVLFLCEMILALEDRPVFGED